MKRTVWTTNSTFSSSFRKVSLPRVGIHSYATPQTPNFLFGERGHRHADEGNAGKYDSSWRPMRMGGKQAIHKPYVVSEEEPKPQAD